MRQSERLSHAPNQRLEDLGGMERGRDFLEDVVQQIAGAQRFVGFTQLPADPQQGIEPRLQLGQVHRRRQHVASPGKQRFRRRAGAALVQEDEHRRPSERGSDGEGADLVGQAGGTRVRRIEEEIGGTRDAGGLREFRDLKPPTHEQPLQPLGSGGRVTDQQDFVTHGGPAILL